MKKLLPTLFLLGSLSWSALPAVADAKVEDLRLNKVADQPGIRFVVVNHDQDTQPGPVTVNLFARANGHDKWELITSWTDDQLIGKTHLAHEVLPGTSPILNAISQNRNWQARVVVQGPTNQLSDVDATYKDTAAR